MLQQNRQAVWQISGSHSGRTEHCCDSSLVLILQHRAVLWLKGVAINWLQLVKINLLPNWSGRRTSLTVVTCRSVKLVPLQHLYVSTDITVSFGSRQQSALQQFDFIIKAPATVISITVRCIIMCSGSRTSKESVSAICSVLFYRFLLVWCGNMNQNWSYKDSCFVT